MPVSERRVINETKALGDIFLSVAGEERLLEAAIGSRSLRCHYANQVSNCGDDISREGSRT